MLFRHSILIVASVADLVWLTTSLSCWTSAFVYNIMGMTHRIVHLVYESWELFVLCPCLVAGVGRAFSRVCLFVRALKGKPFELTPNSHTYSIVVARRALNQRSKDKSHTVMKTVTVTQLLVTCAAMAVCCCCRRGSAYRYDCLSFLVCIVCVFVGLSDAVFVW